jgi:hypothetical protein
MRCRDITCPLNFPHFLKGNAALSQPGRPSGGKKSEWFIRTMKMRRTHQRASTLLERQVISNDFYRAKFPELFL